jgi:hypothetical protein
MPAHSTSSSTTSSSRPSRLSGSHGSRSMEGSGGGSSAGIDAGGSSYDNSQQSQDPSHKSQSSPFTMARDRFQSSAQQLFKNLEDALGSSSSRRDVVDAAGNVAEADRAAASSAAAPLQPWETALRTMFSSCTTDADQNTVPDAGQALSPRSSSNRKASSSSAAVVTPNDSKRKNKKSSDGGARASPTVVQIQGGPPHKDLGEHIYAQLFFDDQIRAAKAVSGAGRGEGDGIRTTASSPAVVSPAAPVPPPPFPVSTQASRIMLSSNNYGAVPTAAELDLTRTMTFDDSISAISAHTLEAMASANPTVHHQPPPQQRARSGESATLFPPETLLQKQQQQQQHHQRNQNQAREPPAAASAAAAAANLGAAPSPFALEHHRSPSSNSRLSKYSHSTRTTESSSFDHWQQEDNKYWAEVAAEQGGDDPAASSRRPSRKSSNGTPTAQRKVRLGNELSTKAARRQSVWLIVVSISLLHPQGRIPPSTTNPRSPHRHPHDTTPLYSSGAYDFDPLEVPRGSMSSSGGGSNSIPSRAAKKKGPFHRGGGGPRRSRAPAEPQFSEI